MNNVVSIRGGREAPRSSRRSMETMIFSREEAETWLHPPFQRPIRINDKVRLLAETIVNDGGVVPGVLTLGKLAGEKRMWIVDGQHRLEAFKLTNLEEFICDARLCHFDTMGEMAVEFVELNSALVKMRPDDILRGLEPTSPGLALVRRECPYVGYDQIRRGGGSPIVSMATVVRCWFGSQPEAPVSGATMGSAAKMGEMLTEDEAGKLVAFLKQARSAWGNEPENYRLWGSLNLAMLMWMWRRTVMVTASERLSSRRATTMTPDMFKRCLMSVSASGDYNDWLVGRMIGNRDRTPCYNRLKAIFVARIRQEIPGSKPMFPQPAWSV